MYRSIDHDRFVEKNRSIARSQEIETKDKALARKGYSFLEHQREASCYTCKMKRKNSFAAVIRLPPWKVDPCQISK
jgi:hypothetical protein